MNEDKKEIILPKNLQIQMLKFFLKTSILRSINQKSHLSENSKEDR